jgi:hypothetical protein
MDHAILRERAISRPKAHVKALLRDLERIFGQERNNWSLVLLRSLWPALYPGITRRGRSLAHENTWLYLAGFVLRPGYYAQATVPSWTPGV